MAGTDYKLRIKGQDDTKKAFNSVKGSVNSTGNAMNKLKGIIAGAFAVGSIVAFSKHTLQLADDIGKVSDSLGVNTTFLQKFQFAAQQSGLTTEEFNKGMQNFTKMVGQAQLRTSEAGRSLEKLGVQVKNADGSVKGAEEVFLELFTALDNVGSQFEKNAILADLMGRAGVKLAVMGKDGSEAMTALANSATGVLDEETIRRAERFNDTMNILKRQILAPVQTLFINAANSVIMFMDAIGLIEIPKTMEELQNELATLTAQQEKFNQAKRGQFTRQNLKDQTEAIELIQKEITVLEAAEKTRKQIADAAIGQMDAAKSEFKAIGNLSTTLTGSFTEFFDFTKKGFLDFENLSKRILASVINEMVKVFIIKKIMGFGASAFGVDSTMGKIFTKAGENFEGGGYTGSGARVGGLDGRGGFMAMVHPNETIIDHTKGQPMGSTTVNFNINTVDATGFDQLLISRKNTITQIINNAMNNQGKMGVV